MTSRDFAYWLQGFFEMSGADPMALTFEQTALVRAHLALVFIHEIDPSFPKEQQAALDAAHGAGATPAAPTTFEHDDFGGETSGGTVYRC